MSERLIREPVTSILSTFSSTASSAAKAGAEIAATPLAPNSDFAIAIHVYVLPGSLYVI